MSSLTIVAVPVALPSVATVGFESATVNVSSGSTVVSPFTGTLICALVVPALKIRVPLSPHSPNPACALPSCV